MPETTRRNLEYSKKKRKEKEKNRGSQEERVQGRETRGYGEEIKVHFRYVRNVKNKLLKKIMLQSWKTAKHTQIS